MDFARRISNLAFGPYIDVQVVDHCNLGCRGCLHFAPVAEPRFLDLAEVATVSDLERFRRKAHPMCRFCDNDKLAVVEWARSKRVADEWLVKSQAASPTKDGIAHNHETTSRPSPCSHSS